MPVIVVHMTCGDPQNPEGPGHKSNGDPCNNPVVPGMFRCYMHGGKTPVAKLKAENAMALLRMPAIEIMHKVLSSYEKTIDQFNADTCATCGNPTGDLEERQHLIKTCRSAATAAAQVLEADGDLDPKLFTVDERQRLVAALAVVKTIKGEIRARLSAIAFGQPVPTQQPSQTM